MKALIKTYISDAAINMFSQLFILLAGCLALLCGSYTTILWMLFIIGYSFLLAKLSAVCVKKEGNDLRHYFLFVMLPPNVIALAAACGLFVSSVVPGHSLEVLLAVIILGGSVAITMLSLLFNRIVFRRSDDIA